MNDWSDLPGTVDAFLEGAAPDAALVKFIASRADADSAFVNPRVKMARFCVSDRDSADRLERLIIDHGITADIAGPPTTGAWVPVHVKYATPRKSLNGLDMDMAAAALAGSRMRVDHMAGQPITPPDWVDKAAFDVREEKSRKELDTDLLRDMIMKDASIDPRVKSIAISLIEAAEESAGHDGVTRGDVAGVTPVEKTGQLIGGLFEDACDGRVTGPRFADAITRLAPEVFIDFENTR